MAHGKVIAESKDEEIIGQYRQMLEERIEIAEKSLDEETLVDYNVALWFLRAELAKNEKGTVRERKNPGNTNI